PEFGIEAAVRDRQRARRLASCGPQGTRLLDALRERGLVERRGVHVVHRARAAQRDVAALTDAGATAASLRLADDDYRKREDQRHTYSDGLHSARHAASFRSRR